MKRTLLKRRTPLRARAPKIRLDEPGRAAWKAPHGGYCECCGRFALRLQRHHVLLERLVREAGGDPWDLANSMMVSEICHARHHSAFRRLPLAKVPRAAVEFAVALLGEDAALLYFVKSYAADRRPA